MEDDAREKARRLHPSRAAWRAVRALRLNSVSTFEANKRQEVEGFEKIRLSEGVAEAPSSMLAFLLFAARPHELRDACIQDSNTQQHWEAFWALLSPMTCLSATCSLPIFRLR